MTTQPAGAPVEVTATSTVGAVTQKALSCAS